MVSSRACQLFGFLVRCVVVLLFDRLLGCLVRIWLLLLGREMMPVRVDKKQDKLSVCRVCCVLFVPQGDSGGLPLHPAVQRHRLPHGQACSGRNRAGIRRNVPARRQVRNETSKSEILLLLVRPYSHILFRFGSTFCWRAFACS